MFIYLYKYLFKYKYIYIYIYFFKEKNIYLFIYIYILLFKIFIHLLIFNQESIYDWFKTAVKFGGFKLGLGSRVDAYNHLSQVTLWQGSNWGTTTTTARGPTWTTRRPSSTTDWRRSSSTAPRPCSTWVTCTRKAWASNRWAASSTHSNRSLLKKRRPYPLGRIDL